jgi:hypothetical protein
LNEGYLPTSLDTIKNDEHGFLSPYLYFLSLIIISIILSFTFSIQNERELVWLKEEQLKLNTLLQSGIVDFKQTQLNVYGPSQTKELKSFEYPDGIVQATYSVTVDQTVAVHFYVKTNNQSTQRVDMNLPLSSFIQMNSPY